MTFLAPGRLWLLVVVGALLAAYVVLLARRRRFASAYASPELFDRVAPHRPGWRRHLPAAGILVALVTLVVGAAQPARAERVARQHATVMLVIDVSASMEANDVAPSRIEAARAAAEDFVRGLPDGFDVGVAAFSGTARVLASPTTDRGLVLRTLASLQTAPGTAAGDGILAALDALQTANGTAQSTTPDPATRIVLLSDGLTTVGTEGTPITDAVTAAKDAGVPITTISFGTAEGTIQLNGQTLAVPADPALLQQIARDTGGSTFTAATGAQLRRVYDDIGRRITYRVEQHELAAVFAGVALALLLAAAATSVLGTTRLA